MDPLFLLVSQATNPFWFQQWTGYLHSAEIAQTGSVLKESGKTEEGYKVPRALNKSVHTKGPNSQQPHSASSASAF